MTERLQPKEERKEDELSTPAWDCFHPRWFIRTIYLVELPENSFIVINNPRKEKQMFIGEKRSFLLLTSEANMYPVLSKPNIPVQSGIKKTHPQISAATR